MNRLSGTYYRQNQNTAGNANLNKAVSFLCTRSAMAASAFYNSHCPQRGPPESLFFYILKTEVKKMKCDYIEIGNRIREIRQNGKWSQAAFAEMLSVSREQIARIEAGVRTPSLEFLVNVAAAGGISLDYLVFGVAAPSFLKKQLQSIIELLSDLEHQI